MLCSQMFFKEQLLVICVGITWGASLKMQVNRTCGINMAGKDTKPNNLCFKLVYVQPVLENIALVQSFIRLLTPQFNIPDKWPLAYY